MMRYVDLQRVADEAQRHGMRQYARSHFIRAMPDAFVESMRDGGGADTAIAGGGGLG